MKKKLLQIVIVSLLSFLCGLSAYAQEIVWCNGGTFSIDADKIGGVDATYPNQQTISLSSNVKKIKITYSVTAGAATVSVAGSPVPTEGTIVDGNTVTYEIAKTEGSSDPLSITVTWQVEYAPVSFSVNKQSCNLTPSITIENVIGGSGSYTYAWAHDGANTTNTATNLQTGSYTATVTDANCPALTTTSGPQEIVKITSDVLTISDPVGTTTICQGASSGNITVNVTGGSGSYTYAWAHDGANTTNTASNLPKGSYTINVTDANCTSITNSKAVSIVEYPEMTIVEPQNSYELERNKTNINVNINVTGGSGSYTYYWNNVADNSNPKKLSAGNHTFKVTDNVCSNEKTQSVTVSAHSDISFDVSYENSCIGLSNGKISISNIQGVNTTNGRQQKITWKKNGAAISGSENQTQLNNLTAGNYEVKVEQGTNWGGYWNSEKEKVETITLTESSVMANATITDVKCFGGVDGEIKLEGNVSGGKGSYTYAWSNGATTANISNLQAGMYAVAVDGGCGSQLFAFNVSQPDKSVEIADANITNVTCYGQTNGKINLIVDGGSGDYSYTWKKNDTPITETSSTLNGIGEGTYNVTVTDNVCAVSTNKTYTITQPTELLASVSQSNYNGVGVRCYGGNDGWLSANVSGGSGYYTYSWKENNIEIATTASLQDIDAHKSYTLTISDGVCPQQEFTDIRLNERRSGGIEIESADITHAITDITGSSNGAISNISVLNHIGDASTLTYQWFPVVGNLNNVASGAYRLVVTDINGCSASTVFNVQTITADNNVITVANNGIICTQDPSTTVIINSDKTPSALPEHSNISELNITYKWECSENNGASWNILAGKTTATITITPEIAEKQYRRICTVRYNYGNSTPKKSYEYTLTSNSVTVKRVAPQNGNILVEEDGVISSVKQDYCISDKSIRFVGLPGTGTIAFDNVATSDPTISLATNKQVNVKYTFTDANGCVGTIEQPISVNPVAKFAIVMDDSIYIQPTPYELGVAYDATSAINATHNPTIEFSGDGIFKSAGSYKLSTNNFTSNTDYAIKASVTTDKGCVSEVLKEFRISESGVTLFKANNSTDNSRNEKLEILCNAKETSYLCVDVVGVNVNTNVNPIVTVYPSADVVADGGGIRLTSCQTYGVMEFIPNNIYQEILKRTQNPTHSWYGKFEGVGAKCKLYFKIQYEVSGGSPRTATKEIEFYNYEIVNILPIDESKSFCADNSLSLKTINSTGGTHKFTLDGTDINTSVIALDQFKSYESDSDHEIIYTYTSAEGCVVSKTESFTVYKAPELVTNLELLYNKEQESQQITLSDKNNTYPNPSYEFITEAVGVITKNSSDQYFFNPNAAGNNNLYNIIGKYTYSNAHCVETKAYSVKVEAANAKWEKDNREITKDYIFYCQNEEPSVITVSPINESATITNGKFSIKTDGASAIEINNDGDVDGFFIVQGSENKLNVDPSLFSTNEMEISFTYYDATGNVPFTVSKIIKRSAWGQTQVFIENDNGNKNENNILCRNVDKYILTTNISGNTGGNTIKAQVYFNNLIKIGSTDVGAKGELPNNDFRTLNPQSGNKLLKAEFVFTSADGDACNEIVSEEVSIVYPHLVNFAFPAVVNATDKAIDTVLNYVTIAETDNGLQPNSTGWYTPYDYSGSFEFASTKGNISNSAIGSMAIANYSLESTHIYDNIKYTFTDYNGCVTTDQKEVLIEKPRGTYVTAGTTSEMPSSLCRDESRNVDFKVNLNHATLNGYTIGEGTYSLSSDENAIINEKLIVSNPNNIQLATSKVVDGSSETEIQFNDTILYTYYISKDGEQTKFVIEKPIVITKPSNLKVEFSPVCYNIGATELSSIVKSTNVVTSMLKFYSDNARTNQITKISKSLIDGADNLPIYCSYAPGGCESQTSSTVAVIKKQAVQFTNLQPSYCSNMGLIPINIEHPDEVSGSLFVVSATDETKLNNQEFDVINYEEQNVRFEYRYSDNYCKDTLKSGEITINIAPQLTFEGFKDNYCDGEVIKLTAKANGTEIQGVFSHVDDLLNHVATSSITISPNDETYINLKNAQVHEPLLFTSETTSQGCVLEKNIDLKINNLPNLEIVNLDTIYCFGQKTSEISYRVNSALAPSGSVTLYDLNGNVIGNTNVDIINMKTFPPAGILERTEAEKKLKFVFRYTDDKGCSNQDEQKVSVYARPIAKFAEPVLCLRGNLTVPFEFTGEANQGFEITKYSWNFGDGKGEEKTAPDSANFFIHRYAEADDRNVSLTIQDTNGCTDTYEKNYTFVTVPKANFVWDNECVTYNSRTQRNETEVNFTNTSVAPSSATYTWKFDTQGTLSKQIVNDKDLQIVFGSEGEKKINLTCKVNENCFDTITRYVYIRPTVTLATDKNYYIDFENETGGWEPEATQVKVNSSWTLAEPNGKIINSAASGSKAWITGADTSYYHNESAAISSPCFDFSKLDKPMFSMNIFTQTEKDHDGAVLQYTTDGGNTWSNIGSLSGGVNWYNSQGISASPGGSVQGWSGTDDTTWVNVRYDLDVVKNQPNVRFRVIFASDAGGTSHDGFAFDDIRIANRTRRVLIEHFTNNNSDNARMANTTVNKVRLAMPADAIDIQYHTSYPQGDRFYNECPIGGAVRENYYGVSNVPYTIVDGVNTFTNTGSSVIDTFAVKSRALYTPTVGISLHDTIRDNHEITIGIKALEPIIDRQLILFVAMVEKTATSVVGSQEIEFRNVLRDMLPLPSGEYIKTDWTAGETQTYKYTYKPAAGINPTNINVIVFVQDELTGEILQVNTTDTLTQPQNYNSVVGIDNVIANQEKLKMEAYPNPATDWVNIYFNNSVSGKVEVINQQGAVVKQLNISHSTYQTTYNVSQLSQGIYILRFVGSNGVATTKIVVE